ncbi:MAG TPA: hypothetical protein PK694_00905 [Rhodospirillales bacterium]|nr:hypothetical protein [Rhodospirillales bacterium]
MLSVVAPVAPTAGSGSLVVHHRYERRRRGNSREHAVLSLAVRQQSGGREIFIGTDDENYGGILRLLPPP